MYRYWDGTAWSPTLTSDPYAAAGGGQPLSSRRPMANPYAGASGQQTQPPRSSGLKRVGWWLAILAIVAGLVFGGLQVLRGFGIDPLNPSAPSNPTVDPCPPESLIPETLKPAAADGRVHGGQLSYPKLASPWSEPEPDSRLPFGRDVSVQQITLQPNFDGKGNSWVASILVAELVAGDGFFSPQEGTELIAKCAMSRFYGDAVVQRDDVRSQAVTVDGRDGWVIETHLSFDISGLNEKGETAIFEVVKISDDSSSIYYASIPDSRPDLLTVARQVQGQLRVDA